METWFQRGEVSIGLIDVGGQRSERKKWLHCFETVNTLLFVVSMSEYDQMLEEDHTVNRMKESIKLFASVSNVKWFAKASMLLSQPIACSPSLISNIFYFSSVLLKLS